MAEANSDESPARKREYSGVRSTLGVAALAICAVAAGIWYLEVRNGSGSADTATESGFGIIASSQNPTDAAPAARKGRAAPNFRLADLNGEAATLDSLRGKFVLLNFWASWCGPCRDETPDLQSLYEQSGNRGLVVLGVNQQEQPDSVRRFAEEFGVTYPVLLDRSGEVSQALRRWSWHAHFVPACAERGYRSCVFRSA